MIIRDIKNLYGTEREVKGSGWTSTRLLLKKDKMGFSMHETIIPDNTVLELHYQNHLEAVFCVEGKGEITDLETDATHQIYPGVLYALDQHDKHILKAHQGLRLVCVFNPPVTGQETHDDSGSYPIID